MFFFSGPHQLWFLLIDSFCYFLPFYSKPNHWESFFFPAVLFSAFSQFSLLGGGGINIVNKEEAASTHLRVIKHCGQRLNTEAGHWNKTKKNPTPPPAKHPNQLATCFERESNHHPFINQNPKTSKFILKCKLGTNQSFNLLYIYITSLLCYEHVLCEDQGYRS